MNRRLSGIFLSAVLLFPISSYAQSAADLETQINAQTQKINALKAEIEQDQQQLDLLGAKKDTLQSAISSLTLSQKQLSAQIQVTQAQIASANLQIRQLSISISDKESSIAADQAAIIKALRHINEEGERPFIMQIVSTDTLGEAWRFLDQALQFNRALGDDIRHLQSARRSLAENREKISEKKSELVNLNTNLTTQKRSVDASKSAQQTLLAQTKNQETNYQKLIAQKQAAEKSFEQELISFQNQLNLIVNPNLLPKIGSGVLSWPFSTAFIKNCARLKNVLGNPYCVTQYFGNTPFATANPQIYKGKGHNAIDIGAPIGTPVLAALGGTVLGTGNTDLTRGCYSFGKWVMVIHGNGLSTIYSHLSTIDVVKGQQVSTGQLVGLSGMTGYATGPHLHFGVYATEGTQIMTLRQYRGATIGCADATMPVATLPAYLNPLSYL